MNNVMIGLKIDHSTSRISRELFRAIFYLNIDHRSAGDHVSPILNLDLF